MDSSRCEKRGCVGEDERVGIYSDGGMQKGPAHPCKSIREKSSVVTGKREERREDQKEENK